MRFDENVRKHIQGDMRLEDRECVCTQAHGRNIWKITEVEDLYN